MLNLLSEYLFQYFLKIHNLLSVIVRLLILAEP